MEKRGSAGITLEKNGPIEVENLERLTNSRGEVVEMNGPVALCRLQDKALL